MPISSTDLEIHVALQIVGDRLRLSYVLESRMVDDAGREIRGDWIRRRPEDYHAQLLRIIEQAHPARRKEIDENLATFGQALYTELFPEELRNAYRAFRDRITTLLIVSETPWIPWELIKPHETRDNAFADDFLCCKFELTRWLADGSSPPDVLGLPELRHGETLAGAELRMPDLHMPEAFRQQSRSLLVLGSFPGSTQSVQGGEPTPLDDLVASSVLNQGCGGFVAPRWPPGHDLAQTFARSFYDSLLSGRSLGEAVRSARLILREEFPDQPAWLAYTVYGHPDARFCPEPASPTRGIAPEPSRTALTDVQFTTYRPNVVRPETWYTMLVFTHLAERPADSPAERPDPSEEVERQAHQVLGEAIDSYRALTADSSQAVPHESDLTLVPAIEGFDFNPPQRSFRWLEDVHREEFRLRAARELAGQTARGRLSIYLGVVLLAEVSLAIRVDAGARHRPDAAPMSRNATRPYRRIFASYSHLDAAIVEQVERCSRLLGDTYLRDVSALRAGEEWAPGILELIRSSDVFQLFWSWNAIDSRHVRQEWEYALSLGRPDFIRPTYWQDPLPRRTESRLPPPELERLHFQRLPIPEEDGPQSLVVTLGSENLEGSNEDLYLPRWSKLKFLVLCGLALLLLITIVFWLF